MSHTAAIGRIVHYYEGDWEAPCGNSNPAQWSGTNGTRWHPAMITRVWTNECVNLVVFKDASAPIVMTSQTLLPDEVFADGVHCTNNGWRWPERV